MQKAVGSRKQPTTSCHGEPMGGFEPSACCLRNSCSTAELHRRGSHYTIGAALGSGRGELEPVGRPGRKLIVTAGNHPRHPQKRTLHTIGKEKYTRRTILPAAARRARFDRHVDASPPPLVDHSVDGTAADSSITPW